jgi:uncharacterized protein YbjT (DUF2867 family)
VLVCGATGRFAALTDVLIGRGHRVLAGTRRPDSAAAQRLRQRGAQIVRVDFDDAATLQHSAAHADAIVAAGTAHAAGPAAHVRHGRAIVDAAAATSLDHLIYLTVAGSEHRTGVPILDGKHEVEQYLRSTDVPHTIVAPAYFMDNLWNPSNAAALAAGRMPSPVSRSRPPPGHSLGIHLAERCHDQFAVAADVADRDVPPSRRDAPKVSGLMTRNPEIDTESGFLQPAFSHADGDLGRVTSRGTSDPL